MTSEIQQEIEGNLDKMQKLIANQKLTVGDANKFLSRYYNFWRKIESLESSRDNWKEKYIKLKVELIKNTQLNAKAGGKS